MDRKLLLFLIVVGVFASTCAYPKTACGSEASHDLILGKRVPGDRVLYFVHTTMPSSFLRIKTNDLRWPPENQHLYATITRVEVYDQMTDGTGGCAFLGQGGVGDNYLLLHLRTQRGGKYDFFIKVYGR